MITRNWKMMMMMMMKMHNMKRVMTKLLKIRIRMLKRTRMIMRK